MTDPSHPDREPQPSLPEALEGEASAPFPEALEGEASAPFPEALEGEASAPFPEALEGEAPAPLPEALEGNQATVEQPGTPPPAASSLSDGAWHRLHPTSPLLKGGIALIAILGVVIANLRERLVEFFIPQFAPGGDPFDYLFSRGLVGYVLLGVAALLIVLITGFYFSWRMHTFRITEEVVEVRSGILFRTNRKARLDRIQGINIVRPFFARLFGAARLEINQAGQDANVQLAYLSSSAADDLRRDILLLASGTRAADERAARADAGRGLIDRRVSELLAPELDPDAAPPQSVVRLDLGRLIGSLALSGGTIFLLLLIAGGITWIAVTGDIYALFFAVPGVIGFGSYYVNKFTRSLRYSIAGTPDGIRVGFGLLSTSNETLPPGRIHSVQVSQPLLWRGPGWWEIKVNRASQSSTKGAAGQANTTILPVGDLNDVKKVLELVLPDLIAPVVDGDEAAMASAATFVETGLTSKGGEGDGFTNSPRRAAWLRPFSWRRNGYAIAPGSLVLRRGAIWRELVIVPQPRLQSVSLHQGPVLRMLRLASVHLHTVAGPISARLGAIDRDAAVGFFDDVARVAVQSAQRDTSHRWRSGEQQA